MLNEKVITVDPHECKVFRNGRELKIGKTFFGYPRVVIFFEGKTWSFYLHKIVWVSQYGAVPYGFEIDHAKDSKGKPSIDKLRLLPWDVNIKHEAGAF